MVDVKLNRRVIVRRWGSTRNDQGGGEPVLLAAWPRYAQVENRTGSNAFQYQQQKWTYAYKVTMRRRLDQLLRSQDTIDYEGQRLKIEELVIDSERFKHFEIARCSTQGAITPTPSQPLLQGIMNRIEYTLPAGADSIEHPALVGLNLANLISVELDGGERPVILTAGLPEGLEVLHNGTTGTLTFPYADPENDRLGHFEYQTFAGV